MDSKNFKGRLKRWEKDKGFGFIHQGNGNQDIFIHISALKNMRRPPVVNDMILFQIHIDNDGKKRAVNARIEGVSAIQRKPIEENKKSKNNWFYQTLLLVLVISLGLFMYNVFFKEKYLSTLLKTETYEESYRCEGKIYCSEMTSCEEATFYQNNCTGTKMDGDGDGIPCESQWCSSW